MTSPTLEQQIEFIELLIPTYEATHGVIDNDKAILASLKRLQAIDAQEAVGVYTGEGLSSVAWRDDVTVGELMGKKLYALPPLPAIPEGFVLVPIKPTKAMIDALCEYMGGLSADKRAIYAYKDAVSAAQASK